jgi:hypothetical protein
MEEESGRGSADQAEVWSPGVSTITPILAPVAALPPSDGAAPQRTERRRTAKAARRAAGVPGCGMGNVARRTLPVWVLLCICSLTTRLLQQCISNWNSEHHHPAASTGCLG